MSREDGSNWLWTGSSLLLKLAVTSSNWLLKLVVTSSNCSSWLKLVLTGNVKRRWFKLAMNWFFLVVETGCVETETSSNWFFLWLAQTGSSLLLKLAVTSSNWFFLAQTVSHWLLWISREDGSNWFFPVVETDCDQTGSYWFLCMTSKYISMEKDGWNWFFLFVQVQSDADNLAGCD